MIRTGCTSAILGGHASAFNPLGDLPVTCAEVIASVGGVVVEPSHLARL